MAVRLAKPYAGSMDEYLSDMKLKVNRPILFKKYAADKAASVLGTPPENKEEIKQRLRAERRNRRIAARARRARILKKLAKLRLITQALAAGVVTLGCPAAAPVMASIVFQRYVETKIINAAADHFDRKTPQDLKEAKTAVTMLKAAKKHAPSPIMKRAAAQAGR